jgi:hypothetical protein
MDFTLCATRVGVCAEAVRRTAEAGHRVVHATQHLHGGIGADVDYPIHRYFLWGKQLGDTLGGASAQAAELGRLLAERAERTGRTERSVA